MAGLAERGGLNAHAYCRPSNRSYMKKNSKKKVGQKKKTVICCLRLLGVRHGHGGGYDNVWGAGSSVLFKVTFKFGRG